MSQEENQKMFENFLEKKKQVPKPPEPPKSEWQQQKEKQIEAINNLYKDLLEKKKNDDE